MHVSGPTAAQRAHARPVPDGPSARFVAVRRMTEALAAPLSPEDQQVQSMPDASPAKWHLAHTTWFFETFLLAPHEPRFAPYDPAYAYLFNSYYEAAGPRHPRPQRGLVTRPSCAEILAYRHATDDRMCALLERGLPRAALAVLELGLAHEEQHQELLVTDAKHLLSLNPLRPAYRADAAPLPRADAPPLRWTRHEGGVVEVGHAGAGFAFDNESPRHAALVRPFELASRAVTCGEWRAFVDDGGYRRPELWLSDGWAAVQARGWAAPLYWEGDADLFTMAGLRALAPAEPACHVSYYEADAFARWAGARLPTEEEWELAASSSRDAPGRFADDPALHPAVARPGEAAQLLGDVWEWTRSAYAPYPGYAPPPGALGEYNGKFMCSQLVLRGGSCATPAGHVRPTYRNFFYPDARWQFSGVRLARDA
jgi:ergothioneine biosynthesis protein EgtB